MRKLLVFLLLALPAFAQTPAVVTVNLSSTTGSALTGNSYIVIRLRNFAGFVPRVVGTGAVARVDSGPIKPDGAGLVTTSVWKNSDITPSGTFYTIEFWDQGKMTSTANWLIDGSPFNLNSQSPIITPPTPFQGIVVLQNPIPGQNQQINQQSGTTLSGTGAFDFTGATFAVAEPTLPAQATTKNYVDTSLATGLATKADLVGGHVPTVELGTGLANASKCLLGDQTWGNCSGTSSSNATSIQDNPVDVGVLTTPGTTYSINSSGTGFTGQTRSYIDARDCGIPQDGSTDSLTSVNACIQAHKGWTIVFPKISAPGTATADYIFSGRILLQGSQTKLIGAAGCSMQILNCVTFSFTSLTGGMDIGTGNTCQGCALENLELRGSYPSSILVGTLSNNWVPCSPPASQTYAAGVVCVTSADGLLITTPFVTLSHVIVGRFGKSCININGNSVADNTNIIDVATQGCHADGLVTDGGDSNAISGLQYHPYYNFMYGLDDSTFLGNAWYSAQATNNHIASATIGSTVNISSYSCNGTVCTVNTSTAHSMIVGNALVMAGTSDDGTYFVASIPTSTQLTFALASSGTGAAAGTVRLTSRNEFYAAAGIVGGAYYYNSSLTSVFIEPYVEGSQNCAFGATAIVLGGSACTDPSGNITGFKMGTITGLPGQVSQNQLNVNSPNDADLNMTIRAGSAAIGPRHAWFKFVDNSLTTIFRIGQGQIGGIDNFIINNGTSDPATSGCFGNCRFRAVDSANTDLSSQGTSPVRINPDNGSGSGGLEIYSGGAGHTLIGFVDASGNANFDGNITTQIATGTAPFVVTSTTPVLNLTAANHPLVKSCGTTTTCAHAAVTNALTQFGNVTLSGGTATVTGLTAYTSSTSFRCTASDNTSVATGANAVPASTTSITVTGTGSDVVSFICVGN